MTRRHFKFIPAIAAGFMAIALSACGGSSSGGAGSSIEPLLAPTITTQPAAQTVTEGQTATFSVTAAGTAPLIYQWQKNSTDISGATSATYTTPATAIADNGAQYSVVVFNGAGTVTSDKATLTVTAASGGLGTPVIGTQPTNQSVAVGQTAKFSVTATGNGTLTYQWQKNGTDISGATSSTYTTPVTVIGDTGTQYSVVVGNSADKVASSKATLTVTAAAVAPAITTQPASQSVTEGQTATFSVIATGTAPLTYQWKKGGTDISGATSSTYTTPATSSADNAAVFTVVVTNGTGTVTSGNATLTVNVPPAISAQPTAQTITAGKTATFSVTATGTGTLSYQWKKNGTNITGGTGATTNTYTTPAMSYAGNGAVYSVEVSDSAGTTTSSSTATLTVSKSSIAKSYGQVANASDGLYDKTECVQDNNTGLVWEGKTADVTLPTAPTAPVAPLVNGVPNLNDPTYLAAINDATYLAAVAAHKTALTIALTPARTNRAGNAIYTNYDNVSKNQKAGFGGQPPNQQTDIDPISNSIGYQNTVVNAGSGLCGFKNWRMPTKDELLGIRDANQASAPYIDSGWFPNTQSAAYWTASPYTPDFNAWTVYFRFFLASSSSYIDDRTENLAVRLVRCDPAATCTAN